MEIEQFSTELPESPERKKVVKDFLEFNENECRT